MAAILLAGAYEFAARQALMVQRPQPPQAAYDVGGPERITGMNRPTLLCGKGDEPVSRHLPEFVAHAADNAQPNGPPSTLTCSRKGTWTSYPAAQARYANGRNRR